MNSLDFSIVVQAWPYLWSGLLFSLSLAAAAFLIGMFLGTLFALVQHFELRVLSPLVRSYVALMRSIPLILVLFWFFFLVPIVLGTCQATVAQFQSVPPIQRSLRSACSKPPTIRKSSVSDCAQ
ncbi:His/Glu/Gln/Arg/opine family amino acid ABC transporter permease subunit [Bradyrhizobium sp. USDA 4541]|nr:His/Glu/Gln/Arg/opine family amino acid ABC transporter permease subunit [Bradyrhizobium sp. USDA 4541]